MKMVLLKFLVKETNNERKEPVYSQFRKEGKERQDQNKDVGILVSLAENESFNDQNLNEQIE